MRLKKHRNDVKWLNSFPYPITQKANKDVLHGRIKLIAKRYRRLILAMEETLSEPSKCFYEEQPARHSKESFGFNESTYATGTNDAPEPIILSRAAPVPVKDDVDWPGPEDIIKMRDKPAKPTRKEWEEWADSMPYALNYYYPSEYIDAKKKWFLTMPGVPKP